LLGYLAEETERFEQTVQVGLYDLEAILQQNGRRISREDGLALEKKHGLPLPLLRYRLWQKDIAFYPVEPKINSSGSGIPGALKGHSHANWLQRSTGANEVADAFLDYHRIRGYQVLPGSSLLDDSIPMSFVMSAGLVQVERASAPLSGLGNRRFVLLQNCFRHFDLNRIGQSSTHLSFFRMLGAFTFGPVDRQEQIVMAWDLITRIYGLRPEKLWVTYFSGGLVAGQDFGPDLDTCHAWRRVGIRECQLLGQSAETNFWQQSAMVMGVEHASKCGPNSEVFYDRGEALGCGPDCRPGCACGRFIEFLNMLFITHVVDEGSQRVSALETPFTEAVIGLERLAMILQGAVSVYEIDCIQPLLSRIRKLSRTLKNEELYLVCQERLLADHLRALLFLAADGAPSPGKGGRAFIVRRLVREILVSLELLGIRAPAYIPELVAQVAFLYRRFGPTRDDAGVSVLNYLASEKIHLQNTLNKGFSQVDRLLAEKNVHWVSGVDILTFEKEYGLPLPLLERYLKEKEIIFNPDAIEAAGALWKMNELEMPN
jgi:alanyl-tRNA synthetase